MQPKPCPFPAQPFQPRPQLTMAPPPCPQLSLMPRANPQLPLSPQVRSKGCSLLPLAVVPLL